MARKDQTPSRQELSKDKQKRLEELKERLIKTYRELRKGQLDREVDSFTFFNHSDFTHHQIKKAFGSYTKFQDEAEVRLIKSLSPSERALLSERKKKFDASATTEDCINDLRALQEQEPMKHITRNYYRDHGRYSDSTWDRFFGTFQEFRRQAGLELTRHQHQLEKHIAKHAANDHYKKFFDSEILPYFNKYPKQPMPGKIKTIMTISDVHDKECDRFTVSLFIETCRLKQPDIIVLNGDIFDLYEFSKFSKDPRHYDILGRFQFIWDNLFRPLRENCPNAQIDFLMGNHEFRLIRLLADATPNVRVVLSDILGLKFSDIFKVDEFQINWVSKADFSAFSKTDVDNEIKKNYRVYYGAYVVSHIPDRALKSLSGTHGHHHTTMLETDAVVDAVSGNSRFVSWVQTPGAHVRDAEYLDSMSKWNTGFLEAVINIETGEVIQKVHQTFGWCVIDGVYYERSNFEEV